MGSSKHPGLHSLWPQVLLSTEAKKFLLPAWEEPARAWSLHSVWE
jgi:hypothetical protein